MTETKDFFEKFGLSVQKAEPELGQNCNIFGTITNILEDSWETFIVEVNFNIKMILNLKSEEQKNIIKNRAFESGIFCCTITGLNDLNKNPELSHPIEAECTTVIFGKKQSEAEQ